MSQLIFTPASAVMLQFNYDDETKRNSFKAAFRALGSQVQGEDLMRLGRDLLSYLAYREKTSAWYHWRSWWPKSPLIERGCSGLDDIHLTTADYRSMGRKQKLHRRGIRILARPMNGPLVRAVGSKEGEIDIIFWRLQTEAWKVFFDALGLNPENPYQQCPVWISLMPKASSDNNFLEPLNFA